MTDDTSIEKINIDKVNWRGSREFFESLGETLDKLDDKDEVYDFTWVGKRKAVIEAGAPINKTFRPDIKSSKNWDTTENLFIEGDNLDALKLLQESYNGKVKMIYIDPPYNTGKDFVYHDNFKTSIEDYDEATDYKDESGNIQFKRNDKTNGRYHSDWLSMMYPRLKLARNLLSDDGVIFISIDDNEQANLKRMCDEIFGEDNFINCIIWYYGKMSNETKKLPNNHEYILVYGRTSNSKLNVKVYKADSEYRNRYLRFIKDDNTVRFGDVMHSTDKLIKLRIKKTLTTLNKKQLDQSDVLFDFNTEFKTQSDVIYQSTIKGNSWELVKEFDTGQKPLGLIDLMLAFGNVKQADLVVDFFSGSATTAHAVMQLNAKDSGDRKWIMIQLPEKTDKRSEAFNAGYKTIPQISRERIRRAGNKIATENPNVEVDYGFRSLIIDDTNHKDVYSPAGEQQQSTLLDVVDNIKDDRSGIDLLFGVLTQSALELNRPFESRIMNDSTVFLYDYFDEVSGLVACFASSIDEETIKAIAKLKPLTAVFRDSSFATSQDKVNLAEHFRILSPDTKVKVI